MDFEYFARLAYAGYRFRYVPRFIAAFRWHGNNVSLQHLPRRAEERRLVQRDSVANDLSGQTLEMLAHWASRQTAVAEDAQRKPDTRVARPPNAGARHPLADSSAAWRTCEILASW